MEDVREKFKDLYESGSNNYFANQSNQKIFNTIYSEFLWGKQDQDYYSGIGSHDKDVIEPYVESCKNIIRDFGINSIVDLGCGDFNVGSKIYTHVDSYTAVDVSSIIIEQGASKYPEVNFVLEDITKYSLPEGTDLVILREVLQHLSNKDIHDIIKVIKNARYVLVTEIQPTKDFIPNADMISGLHTRINNNSAVVLESSPFNYSAQHIVISEIPQQDHVMVTKLYAN